MEFILGFVAGAVVMLIIDFFADRAINTLRKKAQAERAAALAEKRKTLHPREIVTR